MKTEEKETIGMLLDVEHFYGEHEGRMAPVIVTFLVIGIPILLYVYYSLFTIIPIWVFITFELFFAVRMILIILGRESYRLKMYKRQLFDSYTAAADLVTIKAVHADGCIEYTNGVVEYLVVCFNGTIEDKVRHSVALRKFITLLAGDFMFDMYIHNINTTPMLSSYYDKIHNIGPTEAASNFIEILDDNRKRTTDKSKVQCIIFVVRGRRSDWKDIKCQIDTTISSDASKAFKTVYRVSSMEEANLIINRDADTNVFIQDLLRIKHKTGNYMTSRVIKYDASSTDNISVNDTETASDPPTVKGGKSFHITHK